MTGEPLILPPRPRADDRGCVMTASMEIPGSAASRRSEGYGKFRRATKDDAHCGHPSDMDYQSPVFRNFLTRRLIRSLLKAMLKCWMNSIPFRWSISWQNARASKAFAAHLEYFAFHVLRADRHVSRPQHITPEPGQGKTSFLFALIALDVDNLRVREHKPRLGIFTDADVDDSQRLPDADLGAASPDALRNIHGLKHVLAQLSQFVVEYFHRLGRRFQDRGAIFIAIDKSSQPFT